MMYRLIIVLYLFFGAVYSAQAEIEYITSSWAQGDDGEASVNIPVAAQVNDLLLVQVSIRNHRFSEDTVYTPQGWGNIGGRRQDSDLSHYAFYRIATNGDSGKTVTWDFSGWSDRDFVAALSVIRGVDTQSPIADHSVNIGMYWNDLTASSVDTAYDSSMIFAMYAIESGGDYYSIGGGMNEIYDLSQGGGLFGISVMGAYQIQASQGESGNKTSWVSDANENAIARLIAISPAEEEHEVHHYGISYTAPGLTCEGLAVTVTAHDQYHQPVVVTEDISLNLATQPAVDRIVPSFTTLRAGQASLEFILMQGSEQTGIDIDVSDGTASDLDDGGAEDRTLNFVDTAFRFYSDSNNMGTHPIANQIAGKATLQIPNAQNLSLRAVRKNTDTGACEAALFGNKRVQWAYECRNPSECSVDNQLLLSAQQQGMIQRNNSLNNPLNSPLSYSNVMMTFNGQGEAPFSFSFNDAGKIKLYAKIVQAAESNNPGYALQGESNEFSVRPFGFKLDFSDARTLDWQDDGVLGSTNDVSYADSAQSSRYKQAGENFTMTVEAVAWQSGDDQQDRSGTAIADGIPDVSSNLTDNISLPNFGREDTGVALSFSHDLRLPSVSSGGARGQLMASTLKTGRETSQFSGGQGEAIFSWNEVGIIDIHAQLTDYLGAGPVLGIASNVGRFYPAHYTMNSALATPACGGFSYMGQPGVGITYSLQARSVSGTLTKNYFSDFVHSTHTFVAENNNDGINLAARLSGFPVGRWVNGIYSYADSGSFSRLSAPDGPYPKMVLGVMMIDVDGAAITGLDMRSDHNTDCLALSNCTAKKGC